MKLIQNDCSDENSDWIETDHDRSKTRSLGQIIEKAC